MCIFFLVSKSQILPTNLNNFFNATNPVVGGYAFTTTALTEFQNKEIQISVSNHYPLSITWNDQQGHIGGTNLNNAPFGVVDWFIDDIVLVNYNRANTDLIAVMVGRQTHYNGIDGTVDVIIRTAKWDGSQFILQNNIQTIYSYTQTDWYPPNYQIKNRVTIDDNLNSRFCIGIPTETQSFLIHGRLNLNPSQDYFTIESSAILFTNFRITSPDISYFKMVHSRNPLPTSNLDPYTSSFLISFIENNSIKVNGFNINVNNPNTFNFSNPPNTIVNTFTGNEIPRSTKICYEGRVVSIVYDVVNDLLKKTNTYLYTEDNNFLLNQSSDFINNLNINSNLYYLYEGLPSVAITYNIDIFGNKSFVTNISMSIQDRNQMYMQSNTIPFGTGVVTILRKFIHKVFLQINNPNLGLQNNYYIVSSNHDAAQELNSSIACAVSDNQFITTTKLAIGFGAYHFNNNPAINAKVIHKIVSQSSIFSPLKEVNELNFSRVFPLIPPLNSQLNCMNPNFKTVVGFCPTPLLVIK